VKDGIIDNRCNVLTMTLVKEGNLAVLALCLKAQAAINSVTPLPSVDVKLPAPVESRRTKTSDVDENTGPAYWAGAWKIAGSLQQVKNTTG
jgi:hypothetical protein